MSALLKEGSIFGLGNPLLDITAYVDDDFLAKYGLPKNSAILAEPKHESLYEDLIQKYDIDYTAGGATQNTMRYAEWVVGKNNSITSFMGCIGNDYFGKMMERKAKGDGVTVKYMVDETGSPTGTCAVLITDKGANRSLCAQLGASEKIDLEFLSRNFYFAEKAKVYYLGGHALPVTPDSCLYLAKHAHEWGKDLFFNLAAPYASLKYGKQLGELMPYIDFIFGNEVEWAAYAESKGYKTKDMKEIAKLVTKEPKIKYTNKNIPKAYKQGRVVVITQEANPVLVARTDSNTVEEYPVPQLPPEKIIDTNGAGDAFTGGFLAMYVQDKPIATCIKCAIYCATECIQLSGCTFPKECKFKE